MNIHINNFVRRISLIVLISTSLEIPLSTLDAKDNSFLETQQTILDHGFSRIRKTWTPNKEDTASALVAIHQFLEVSWKDQKSIFPISDGKKIAHIKNNLSKFGVQFFGIGPETDRQIWCNFFPIAEHPKWKTTFVNIPKKNNPFYWDIIYRVNTKNCDTFKYPWVKL